MVNRKGKEENWKTDPRCPTFNKHLQKWINKEEESGEKMISPKE